jgi:hypothetical protein
VTSRASAGQLVQRGQFLLPAQETGQPGWQVVQLAARRRGRDLLPQHRPLQARSSSPGSIPSSSASTARARR